MLPGLYTDTCIQTAGRLLVIETKFTESLREHRSVRKLKEEHLYQVFAYLMNLSRDRRFNGLQITGVLLYPMIGEADDVSLQLHDFPFAIRNVNLATPWQQIAAQLHEICRSPTAVTPRAAS